MTVLNTSYTTLEEAWGNDFTKKSKKKSNLKDFKDSNDPLCQLYGRKYQKTRKPFLDKSVETQNGKNFKSGGVSSSRNRYFGYNDEDINFSADGGSECIQHNKIQPDLKKKALKKKGVRFNIETEDEDDVYLHNAIKDERILNGQAFHDEEDLMDFKEINSRKQFYDDVYESDNEDYDLPEEQHVGIEEERVYYKDDSLSKNKIYYNQYKDERQYFDLLIYILSGIILIFMMEQFIQIGMRLKNSPVEL